MIMPIRRYVVMEPVRSWQNVPKYSCHKKGRNHSIPAFFIGAGQAASTLRPFRVRRFVIS